MDKEEGLVVVISRIIIKNLKNKNKKK